jgi:aminopeptidase N
LVIRNLSGRAWMSVVAFVCLFGVACLAQIPEGIPRDLARQRAQQISDVRYRLSYTLTPQAPNVSGHEEMTFRLTAAAPVVLDFREGTAQNLVINGAAAPVSMTNGHITLPASAVRAGENKLALDFTAPVAPAGKAITRFEDKDDGSEYIYTLFVPMDADMAFPCFDQPDIKARFHLDVNTPPGWTVVSNTPIVKAGGVIGGVITSQSFEFAETQPISTYLFAFAAGPFQKVHDTPGLPGVYVRKSKLQRAEAEAPEVQQVTADGIKYLSAYFNQPFPFPKYDMVLIPGFAYGGMEHAGSTFLREESILFRTAPTHSDHLNRDILLLHELTHQWFGDLVTMRWFDDLWLKEGFAQYMAYHALADLMPKENVWKRFYQAIKPAAYGIDSTQGTTPIYQDIPNLKDAKSAYGAIVYSKAPGVIKQLAFVLTDEKFRDGLRLYLKDHAYANAEWSDLVRAFEKVSGKQLGGWADAYIKRRGMPQVDVERYYCDHPDKIQSLVIRQHDALGEGGLWPISTQVLLGYSGRAPVRLQVQLNSERTDIGREAHTNSCPDYIFTNDQDYAYGRFLLDAHSRKTVMEQLGGIPDVFERALLWGSLWDSVREAELAPREYIDLALRLLPGEDDESLAQSLIGRTTTALHRYVSPTVRNELAAKAEALAYDQMLHAQTQDMRITWFRALRGFALTDQGRGHLKDLLSGKVTVPGVELRPLDRWSMLATLIALHDPDADTILAAEQKRDPSGEGQKYAYLVQAARPDSKTKQQYFDDYLHNPARPEDWEEGSLGDFNYWNQSDLTAAYLKPALDALPQVKRERKIFFMLAWLNAFIGGQQSEQAQTQVHDFLKTASLDKDLRLKILEVSDELDRTVKIRKKYQ